MRSTGNELSAAIDAAVRQGLAEAERLQERIDAAFAALGRVADGARGVGSDDATAVVRAVREDLRTERARAADLFARQRKTLGKFNIAVFGRTGAGKSSLIEALTHGDGHRVSRGESDWTTEVAAVSWGACRVYDTPGINGWGRSGARSELEARARHAAEVADVVVLAFDSQNQLESEFNKIGRWIEELGKPVVAVLNYRNPRWRVPVDVPAAAARAQVSLGVAQHAANIREQLARIGLTDATIVAIHARRAQWSRASEPYRGPDAVEYARVRARFTRERLEASSNLPAFEALLTDALAEDASALRLGMLRAEVLGIIAEASRKLEAHESALHEAIGVLERRIATSLCVIGYPAEGEARSPVRSSGSSGDLLTELERLRDEPFSAPAEGELDRLAAQLLGAHLGPLRSAARNRAENEVLAAFERRDAVSPEALERAIIDRPAIERATGVVLSEVGAYLAGRLNLAASEAALDLRTLLWSAKAVEGSKGSTWAKVGTGLRILGIVAGVAGAIGAFVAGGWAAIAVSAVAGAVSWLFDWGGKKARTRAEAERLRARASALAETHRAVHRAFDEVQAHVLRAVARQLRERALASLADVIRETVSCRRLADALRRAREELATTRAGVPARNAPAVVFARAARRVEQRRFPKDRDAARKLWLGEDWITDPEGLRSTVIPSAHGTPRPRATRWAADDPRRRTLFEHLTSDVSGGDGHAWLTEAQHVLEDDDAARGALVALVRVARGRPKVFVCGDYNAGKTTFIRRLFIESGLPVPDGLVVSAEPTTAEVRGYPWEGVEIVDTPGFQSGVTGHREAALDAIPEASLVIWLVQPAVVSGEPTELDAVLRGDDTRGVVPKLPRTLFVVHRADTLGPDPDQAPDEFANLCARKTKELVAALAARGIEATPDRVFCMASDPFGISSNDPDATRETFDAFRHWDGVDEFRGLLFGTRDSWQRSAVDVSILESGVARLTALTSQAEAELASEERMCTELRGLAAMIESGVAELTRIEAVFRDGVDRRLILHADALVAEALETVDEAAQTALAKRLGAWWEDEHLHSEIERWELECQREVERITERLGDDLQRRLDSVSFRHAFPAATATLGGFGEKKKKSGSKLVDAMGKVGKAMSGTTREAVLRTAREVGYRFRPWGAVKAASALRAAGLAISVATTVFDVVSFVRDLRAEDAREGARRRLRCYVDESRAQVLESLTRPDAAGDGFVAYLNAKREAVHAVGGGVAHDLGAHVARRDGHASRHARYRALVESARRRLKGASREP